ATGDLFSSTCAWKEIMDRSLQKPKLLRAKTELVFNFVLKPVHSCSETKFAFDSCLKLASLCSETRKSWHVRSLFENGVVLSFDDILVYNTFFEKHVEPLLSDSLLCFKSKKLVHILKLFFKNCVILSFDNILVYNTFFDKDVEPLLNDSHVELKLLCSDSDRDRHVLKLFYGISCLQNILIYNTYFDKHDKPWLSNSRFTLDLLCSKSERLVHKMKLFFRKFVISSLDTILVYNTYFDRHHDHLKHVLHVLGKESLVSDLNKYIACTYDPGILVSVLSVQDKQVQPQRSVRDERRDHGYQPEIW